MQDSKIDNILKWFETFSPISIKPSLSSLTVGLSRRFFLFKLLQQLSNKIEEDPDLNFISVLKHYKILGKFLHGTIHEFYRDRNKSYFKKFFTEPELYELVKTDLEWVYLRNKKLKLTITKNGVIVYDNYKKNSFNILLLTIHSGSWVPKSVLHKQELTTAERIKEEDIDTHKIYSQLIFKKSGIWIDNKMSRFACDFNRKESQAIYKNRSEVWFDKLWKTPLNDFEQKTLLTVYQEFYFTLSKLVDTYRFNIIFDGHSMREEPGRPAISFGTEYIPTFYMPVVKSMREKLLTLGYDEVGFNEPFGGGHILQWLSKVFPDVFLFSMEINKKLYYSSKSEKSDERKVKTLGRDIVSTFDIPG